MFKGLIYAYVTYSLFVEIVRNKAAINCLIMLGCNILFVDFVNATLNDGQLFVEIELLKREREKWKYIWNITFYKKKKKMSDFISWLFIEWKNNAKLYVNIWYTRFTVWLKKILNTIHFENLCIVKMILCMLKIEFYCIVSSSIRFV